MKLRLESLLFDIAGLACCIVPPVACTCSYFPAWKQTVSGWQIAGGTAAIIAVVAFIVLSKYLKARIKTPSPVWLALVMWLFFEMISGIVMSLRVIALWMFIGCAVGAVFFWLADQAIEKAKKG